MGGCWDRLAPEHGIKKGKAFRVGGRHGRPVAKTHRHGGRTESDISSTWELPFHFPPLYIHQSCIQGGVLPTGRPSLRLTVRRGVAHLSLTAALWCKASSSATSAPSPKEAAPLDSPTPTNTVAPQAVGVPPLPA